MSEEPHRACTEGAELSPKETRRRNRVLLREIREYHQGRRRVGATVLSARSLRREAHLITLEDGEHLMIFVVNDALTHWAAARDPMTRLHRDICRWLSESPWQIGT